MPGRDLRRMNDKTAASPQARRRCKAVRLVSAHGAAPQQVHHGQQDHRADQ